jgi:hypothetical protein
MEISREEFDEKFQASLDNLLKAMAENAEIDVKKFYSMTCILENLSFFSPVFYGILEESRK